MTYPLTPVPFSIGTADGFLAKTDKSKSFQYLTKDCEDAPVPAPESTLVVYDGNAYFYYLKEIPANFSKICDKIFGMMSMTADAVFSTDMYSPNSVKSMERERRGCSDKLIIKGSSTKKPPNWKMFLANDENKTQFISLLCTVWSNPTNASKLQGRNVILIVEGAAYHLTSEDGKTTEKTEIESLRSTQEGSSVLHVWKGQGVSVHSHQKSGQRCLLHPSSLCPDIERSGHTIRHRYRE